MNQFKFLVGRKRELFVDDMLVDQVKNLAKVLHSPEKYEGNPIISGDKPWENNYIVNFGVTIFDEEEEIFRMWYMLPKGFAYAVSEDGLNWEKPLFDIFPFNGEKTNIVYKGINPDALDKGLCNLCDANVIKDRNEKDPTRRYKLFTFQASLTSKQVVEYGHYIAFSPDGIHWNPRKEPVITKKNDPYLSDRHSVMYDTVKERFVAFTKHHLLCPDGIGDQGVMKRCRGISFSQNFITWTKPKLCMVPDDYDDRDLNFYSQTGFNYESMYLGYLEVYHSSELNPEKPRMKDIQLISSRDGEHWWRAGNRKTFIECGGKGKWDAYMLDIPSSPPILIGNELWIYYGGRMRHHTPPWRLFPDDKAISAIGLVKLRRDGFVSYDAGGKEGVLQTKPLRIQEGSKLHLNVDASNGKVDVEVLKVITIKDFPKSEPGWSFKIEKPYDNFKRTECNTITGDHIDIVVSWKRSNNISQFVRKDTFISLRFYLTNASIYSFWVD